MAKLGMHCDADIAIRRIVQCTIDDKRWITKHQLLLNKVTTETIGFTHITRECHVRLRESTCVGVV